MIYLSRSFIWASVMFETLALAGDGSFIVVDNKAHQPGLMIALEIVQRSPQPGAEQDALQYDEFTFEHFPQGSRKALLIPAIKSKAVVTVWCLFEGGDYHLNQFEVEPLAEGSGDRAMLLLVQEFKFSLTPARLAELRVDGFGEASVNLSIGNFLQLYSVATGKADIEVVRALRDGRLGRIQQHFTNVQVEESCRDFREQILWTQSYKRGFVAASLGLKVTGFLGIQNLRSLYPEYSKELNDPFLAPKERTVGLARVISVGDNGAIAGATEAMKK